MKGHGGRYSQQECVHTDRSRANHRDKYDTKQQLDGRPKLLE